MTKLPDISNTSVRDQTPEYKERHAKRGKPPKSDPDNRDYYADDEVDKDTGRKFETVKPKVVLPPEGSE